MKALVHNCFTVAISRNITFGCCSGKTEINLVSIVHAKYFSGVLTFKDDDRPIIFCTVVSVAFTPTSTTTTTTSIGENTSSATSTTSSTSTTVPSASPSSSTNVEFYSTTASSTTPVDSATELESSTAVLEDIFTSDSYSVPPTSSAAPEDISAVTEFYSDGDSTAVDLVSTPFGFMSSSSELVVSEKQMAMTTEPQRSAHMASVSTTLKASVDKTTAISDGGSGDVGGSGDIDGSGDVDKFFGTSPVGDTTTQDTTTPEVVAETVEVDVTTEDELDLEGDGLFTFGRSTVTAMTRDITTEILLTSKGGGSFIK